MGFFDKPKPEAKPKTQKKEKGPSVSSVRREYENKIKDMELDHKLALKEKEFELKHFKDEEVNKLNSKVVGLEKQVAVLEKENKMLDKIVDLNGDIIDVKDLVSKLVEKLPSIDLKSLTVNNSKD